MKKGQQIKFFNFPFDFDPDANFFLDLIQDVLSSRSYPFPIHFYGCYPKMSTSKKAISYFYSRFSDAGMTRWLKLQQGEVTPYDSSAFNIWCTFENRRPPVEGFDLTFSFDVDSYSGTNCYLPLIYLYVNHNNNDRGIIHSKHSLSICETTQKRELEDDFFEAKSGFLSAFVNNPHPMRLRAIKDLSEVGEIDLFGRSVRNYIEDKIGTAGKYWFNLCFENDLYPGYVTEKILEAWISKSVPLYWGSDKAGILNPDAYVNLKDFDCLGDFVEYVSALYADKDRMKAMIKQPLFKKEFDYASIFHFLIKGLDLRVAESR